MKRLLFPLTAIAAAMLQQSCMLAAWGTALSFPQNRVAVFSAQSVELGTLRDDPNPFIGTPIKVSGKITAESTDDWFLDDTLAIPKRDLGYPLSVGDRIVVKGKLQRDDGNDADMFLRYPYLESSPTRSAAAIVGNADAYRGIQVKVVGTATSVAEVERFNERAINYQVVVDHQLVVPKASAWMSGRSEPWKVRSGEEIQALGTVKGLDSDGRVVLEDHGVISLPLDIP